MTYRDDRLYVKEFVVGVDHGGLAAAYPFSVLNDQPVVNDQVGDLSLLVVFNADTGAATVFNRQLDDGRILTFNLLEDLIIEDAETGTTWDGFTGEAIDGPLTGVFLTPVKHTTSFWFGWKDWYPETEIYGLE